MTAIPATAIQTSYDDLERLAWETAGAQIEQDYTANVGVLTIGRFTWWAPLPGGASS